MIEPIRKCVGCGRKAGKKAFIRVCKLPDGTVIFDPEQKNQGRSLYFCSNKECFRKLMRRGAPEKLLKSKIPDLVRDAIESYLSPSESVS